MRDSRILHLKMIEVRGHGVHATLTMSFLRRLNDFVLSSSPSFTSCVLAALVLTPGAKADTKFFHGHGHEQDMNRSMNAELNAVL